MPVPLLSGLRPETDVRELCPQNAEVTGISLHFSGACLSERSCSLGMDNETTGEFGDPCTVHTPKTHEPHWAWHVRWLVIFAFFCRKLVDVGDLCMWTLLTNS